MLYHILLFSIVSDEKSTVIQFLVPLFKVSFFSGCVRDFFHLYLALGLWCFSHGFVWVHLLGVHWDSWICAFISYVKFGKFSACISSNIISVPQSLSSSETLLVQKLDPLILPHRILMLGLLMFPVVQIRLLLLFYFYVYWLLPLFFILTLSPPTEF